MSDDAFLESYLEAALWSSISDFGEPLDYSYTIDDFTPEALGAAKKDCEGFKKLAGPLLDDLDETQVAHDFWLTRNGHGAGFWDGDYEQSVGEQLTKIANSFGDVYLFVNSDDLIEYE